MKQLMIRAHSGDVMVHIGVELDNEGYSPDIIDDVANRVTAMMRDLSDNPIDDPPDKRAILAEIMGGS